MRAIAPGLFTDEPQPRLVGGRHRDSGRIVFPCPPGNDYEPHPLRRDGTLWSWTIQRYRPKSPPYAGPEAFAPWPVGYVELAGETIVEARLANVAFADVHIGMPLELTFIPLDPAAAEPVMIHAFQPAGARA
ncbi:MAG: OB-fold domain-containing protein [Sphingomonadales bacterium]|nr:OB-fold domain-containing protein [Sphingomonadales bacterium]